ncbi:TetR/AcrR family transcriptional regulator [Pseudothauera nasutitermitis]|uniref:TetR/AcrR family transcriptional regulator n=1 Tax=Pseudothauera nasutitermitis TaxID=2565930 RepID=A0A4S4AX59_9RHOO|nr:TetR/AcrR family transcriptional regulator [Pseudothauera nasutitermitis]THF64624.1 TetR/AcrR family transcriptional regulator [Pseudothauera nasutitermitis]
MSADPCSQTECSRSEARRTQILDAARDCFRQYGFHGASISRICKQAGMSPGHIYHYFENKEAIIAAIVEQDLSRLLTMTAGLHQCTDLHNVIRNCSAEGVHENLNGDVAALKLEIYAEGSRNPRVAEIVHAADRSTRETMKETMRATRASFGFHDDDSWLDGLVEFFATLYDGLLVRSVRNPQVSREALVTLFQRVTMDLLTSPALDNGVSSHARSR